MNRARYLNKKLRNAKKTHIIYHKLIYMNMYCSVLLQVRVVFLYWLPCLLRMSRPNPEDDEEKLDKKAQQLQSVELKER